MLSRTLKGQNFYPDFKLIRWLATVSWMPAEDTKPWVTDKELYYSWQYQHLCQFPESHFPQRGSGDT